jgi:hypothetical protein
VVTSFTARVGETVATPVELTLPLPIPGGAPMTMSGETKMKLVSVDTDGGVRLARFESTTDGKIAASQAGGAGGMSMDMTLGGDGTTVVDLDKGVLRSAETHTRFNGKLNGGAAAPALPPISMQGTMTISIAGK